MKKSLITLLVVFTVLLIVYFAVKSAKDVTYQPEPFVKMDTARVEGIAINSKGNFVQLRKISGVWQVTEPLQYPAETRLVNDLLGRLKGMDIEDVISEDPGKDSLFQVDASGTEIAITQGADTLGHFIIGKQAANSRHVYARRVNQQKTYLVKGTFAGQFTRKAKDWRSKVILEIPREEIARVDYRTPTGDFALVKQDTIWMLEQGGLTLPTEKPMVDRTLNSISRFRTVDFLDGDSARAIDFSNPEFSFTVTSSQGTQRIDLKMQPTDSTKYCVKCVKKEGSDNTLFVIYKGSANAVMPKAEDLKEKPKPETPEMPVSTRTVPQEKKK